MRRYFFAATKYIVSTTFLCLPLLRSPFQHHVMDRYKATIIVRAANAHSRYEEFRETLWNCLRCFERSFVRMIVRATIHLYRETGPSTGAETGNTPPPTHSLGSPVQRQNRARLSVLKADISQSGSTVCNVTLTFCFVFFYLNQITSRTCDGGNPTSQFERNPFYSDCCKVFCSGLADSYRQKPWGSS